MMYATPLFEEITRKRSRDEDDDGGNGSTSFGEHRNKRLQCLPLRTSPAAQKRWSGPPAFPPTSFPSTTVPHTITPQDSDSEEPLQAHTPPRSHFSPWSSSQPDLSQQPSPFHPELDDIMMDAASTPPPPASSHLEPGPFHAEPVASTIAGRMPTPIQPSFAAQVRAAGAWGGPGPALHHHPQGINNLGHMVSLNGGVDRTVPRTLEITDSEWHSVQTRRLPSPISEGEDMCSPRGMVMSPGMVLDSGFSAQLCAEPVSEGQERDMAMDLATGSPNIATTTLTLSQTMSNPEVSSAPATPSPGRKGHIRSRHTVNTWTWQPGMKKSFSIGYRADCEKCRLRVPGHFNHIIIS